jgi:hypothetical protein
VILAAAPEEEAEQSDEWGRSSQEGLEEREPPCRTFAASS